MIKVGKILEIRGIFLIFFDFWGRIWGEFWIFGSTRSSSEHSECGGGREKGEVGGGVGRLAASECSECSECSDDKKVWGGGGFFVGGFGFFCKFAEMYGFFEKEIF